MPAPALPSADHEPPLPCSGHRSRSFTERDFYLSATPRDQLFEHLVTNQAPENHSGRCLLPGLVTTCVVVVTPLESFTSRPNSICPSLPAGHSFCPETRAHAGFAGFAACMEQFRRVELRSTRLPVGIEFSHFGNVSTKTYWLALSGLKS